MPGEIDPLNCKWLLIRCVQKDNPVLGEVKNSLLKGLHPNLLGDTLEKARSICSCCNHFEPLTP